MQAPVLNAANEEVGTRELKEDVFGIDVNEALLWEMVRMQEARRRQGTHKVKTRGEVSGSGKKLWRQKGTGRARVGTRKSPVWRGGGIVFGPTPRNYYYSMPKKKRRAALRSALAGKLRDGELLVVDSFGLTEIKTKALASVLEKLSAQNALIVTTGADELIDLSARNIPTVKVIRCEGLNVYDILRYDKLVFVGDALDKIQGGL
ncbi:MAG: 50S ribosomal protein L4 [Deltaproteobacteria bacterium]|nr:MAG: 50S ribosomal protein L4 [Deltaproteobacteria bacterium]